MERFLVADKSHFTAEVARTVLSLLCKDIPEIVFHGIHAYIDDDKFEEHEKKIAQNGYWEEGFGRFLNE